MRVCLYAPNFTFCTLTIIKEKYAIMFFRVCTCRIPQIKYLRIHQISNNFVGETKMNIVEMKHSIKRNPTSGF